jgi:hypothetical protein
MGAIEDDDYVESITKLELGELIAAPTWGHQRQGQKSRFTDCWTHRALALICLLFLLRRRIRFFSHFPRI